MAYVTMQAQILKLIKALQAEHNTAVMLITHNLGVVWEMCDNVIVMIRVKTFFRIRYAHLLKGFNADAAGLLL